MADKDLKKEGVEDQ